MDFFFFFFAFLCVLEHFKSVETYLFFSKIFVSVKLETRESAKLEEAKRLRMKAQSQRERSD